MTDVAVLAALRAVREMLGWCYIAGAVHAGGRHCVYGCVLEQGLRHKEEEAVWERIEAAARRLYPSLGDGLSVAIAVNNSVGKAAILAVVDDAIAHAEAQADYAEMRAMLAELEARCVREPEEAVCRF